MFVKKRIFFWLLISIVFISQKGWGNKWIFTTDTDFTNNNYIMTNVVVSNSGINAFLNIGTNEDYLIGEWWNKNWNFRKKIVLNSFESISNYQFFISTNEVGLSELLLKNYIQSDLDDVRFIELRNNSYSTLAFWYCTNYNGERGFWIKKKHLDVGDNIIYFYFGNPSCNSLYGAKVWSKTNYSYTMEKLTSMNKVSGIWHFDEGAGTIANDSSGNGLNGTIVSGSWVGSDGGEWDGLNINFINGDSILFNGTTSYVEVPDNPLLDGMTNCTISLWFKLDRLPSIGSNMNFVVKKTNGTPWAYHRIALENPSGVCRIAYYEATNKSVNTTLLLTFYTNLEVGKWYDMAMVFNGEAGKVSLYLNGKLMTESLIGPSAIVRTVSPFDIGKGSTSTSIYFDGIIDEVSMYRRAMSLNEIKANYERRKYISITPVISKIYKMESIPIGGIYYSPTYYFGSQNGALINYIKFNGTNSIKFQIGMSDYSNIFTYEGYDGTINTFYSNQSNIIYLKNGRRKYFRYKVLFGPFSKLSNNYARLFDFTVDYTTNLLPVSNEIKYPYGINMLDDNIKLSFKTYESGVEKMRIVYHNITQDIMETNLLERIGHNIFQIYLNGDKFYKEGVLNYYVIQKIGAKFIRYPSNSSWNLSINPEITYKSIKEGEYNLFDGNDKDGETKIIIPEGALLSPINLKISVSVDNGDGIKAPFMSYLFEPFNLVFNKAVQINFLYLDKDNDGKIDNLNCKEDQLQVAIYNPENNDWMPIKGELDTIKNEISIKVKKLGRFGFFIKNSSEEANKIKFNKFVTSDTPLIFNADIVAVSIFTITGKRIVELKKGDDMGDVIVWDGKDNANKELGSGPYIYIAEKSDGEKVKGVIVIAK